MLPSARSQPSPSRLSSSADSRLFGTRPVSLSLESTCHAEGDKNINFRWLGGATTSHPSFHQPHSSPSHHIPASLEKLPPPQHLQGFLHNKTSPDLELIPLSQHLIGKQWKGDKPLPCADPKLLCTLPTRYAAEEVFKIPQILGSLQ